MSTVIKLLGSEITLTTANNVGSQKLVRVVNTDAANTVVLTQKNAAGTTTYGTFTVLPRADVFVEKAPTDTLEVAGTATVKAGAVAYKN